VVIMPMGYNDKLNIQCNIDAKIVKVDKGSRLFVVWMSARINNHPFIIWKVNDYTLTHVGTKY
jgi:hypothetical protein